MFSCINHHLTVLVLQKPWNIVQSNVKIQVYRKQTYFSAFNVHLFIFSSVFSLESSA